MSQIVEWMKSQREVLEWAGVASLVTFAASIVVLPIVVGRIPADYFVERERYGLPWRFEHPVLRGVLVVLKNICGGVLVLAGCAMLVLPGQGLLTLFAGIVLLDFPGKRALERRIVAQRSVLRTLNWIRAKSGHEPLLAPRESTSRLPLDQTERREPE